MGKPSPLPSLPAPLDVRTESSTSSRLKAPGWEGRCSSCRRKTERRMENTHTLAAPGILSWCRDLKARTQVSWTRSSASATWPVRRKAARWRSSRWTRICCSNLWTRSFSATDLTTSARSATNTSRPRNIPAISWVQGGLKGDRRLDAPSVRKAKVSHLLQAVELCHEVRHQWRAIGFVHGLQKRVPGNGSPTGILERRSEDPGEAL